VYENSSVSFVRDRNWLSASAATCRFSECDLGVWHCPTNNVLPSKQFFFDVDVIHSTRRVVYQTFDNTNMIK